MGMPVCTVGDKFSGYCSSCDCGVTGTVVTGSPTHSINGKGICVTGSVCMGDCGHTCSVIGQSSAFTIDGLAAARVGDPVDGTIQGTLVSGSDFVTSD